MLATTHILTGAAIASTKLDPVISLPVAFLSHFVLDAIPHFDEGTFLDVNNPSKKVIIYAGIDVFVGIMLLVLIYMKFKNPFIFWGSFFGLLMDIIDVPFWKIVRTWPIFKQLHSFHDKTHFDLQPKYWYVGIVTQLIILGIILWSLRVF